MKIIPKPYLSMKKLVLTFFGIFGFIWLIVEPLPSLGVLPEIAKNNGKWIYFSMLLISLIGTLFIENSIRFFSSRNKNLISIQIALTELGVNKNIETPKDLRIDIFLESLMKRLAKYSIKNSSLSNYGMYDLTLTKRLGGEDIELDSNLTIKEAEIKEGDIFKIKGTIKPIHRQAFFSMSHTKKGRKRQLEMVAESEREENVFNKFISVAQRVKDKDILIEYFNCSDQRPEWKNVNLPPIDELIYLKEVLKKNNWTNPLIYEKEF